MAQRCFFFEPTDSQVQEDKTDMPELMMFPPTESGGALLGTFSLCSNATYTIFLCYLQCSLTACVVPSMTSVICCHQVAQSSCPAMQRWWC